MLRNIGNCQYASICYSGKYCAPFLGCTAGGHFTCLNGGLCHTNTGTCLCSIGYILLLIKKKLLLIYDLR